MKIITITISMNNGRITNNRSNIFKVLLAVIFVGLIITGCNPSTKIGTVIGYGQAVPSGGGMVQSYIEVLLDDGTTVEAWLPQDNDLWAKMQNGAGAKSIKVEISFDGKYWKYINTLSRTDATSISLEEITVATDATWPPYEFINDTTNEISGFEIDLMNEIAAISALKIEYINVDFDTVLTGIAECKYDAAISAIAITEERKNNMLFSTSYYSNEEAANTEEFAIAVCKTKPELLDRINRGILMLNEDNKLDSLIDKWFQERGG